MASVVYDPENHDWCLRQLCLGCKEIYNDFDDFIVPYNRKELIHVLVEEYFKLGFTAMIETKQIQNEQDMDEYIFAIASQFAARRAYGLAFGAAVMGFLTSTNPKIDWMATIKWRKIVGVYLEKYSSQMKIFEPLLKKILKLDDLTKPIFYYLEMLHDSKCYKYYGAKGVEDVVVACDYRFHYLRKRFELNYMPNGVIPYLFRILGNCLWFLYVGRFKQVRHSLAVVSELIKAINQDTEVFKKFQELFFMVKTMHWATILFKSELKKIINQSDRHIYMFDVMSGNQLEDTTENYLEACNIIPKEHVIPFGIPLPDGEDLDLPTDLIETEAERGPIYKKLWTYKRVLKRSTLPHVARVYERVLACDKNF